MFSKLENIQNLLYEIVRRADASYTMAACRKHLTYKVLKHAKSKAAPKKQREPDPSEFGFELIEMEVVNEIENL